MRTFVTAFFGVAFGVMCTTFAAYAWTGPTQTAPSGNVDAPLNIGTGSQVKNGNLSVNAFTATQNSLFYGSIGVGSSNAPSYTLDVYGNVRVLGSTNPIALTSSWSGFPDTATNKAEISNDTGTYKTLMIVGNKSNNGSTRTVSVWDQLTVNGNMYASGYFHSSDARLKEHVQTSSGLSLIEKLRGVTFEWKKDGTPSSGVIAQEVEKVMPSAVKEDENGMKTVEYDQLIAPIIEAIKEQQKEIDSLKAEVADLKARR